MTSLCLELGPAARFCEVCGTPVAASAAGELRKTVTVLFCDLTGSTALGESLDPEPLRALLARYFERMKGIVEMPNVGCAGCSRGGDLAALNGLERASGGSRVAQCNADPPECGGGRDRDRAVAPGGRRCSTGVSPARAPPRDACRVNGVDRGALAVVCASR